jgi:tetratricopeptide (TPR) repeat protein
MTRCNKRNFMYGVVILSAVYITQSACAQQTTDERDPRVGQKILVIKAGAELRTPKATVWRAYLGDVFTVTLTNGEWLWVQEKGGWLWERDAVMFDSAVKELSKKLTTTPTAENHHLRGVALLAHKQYDRAVADFNESLRRQPQNPGALNNRGQAHYLNKNYDAAIGDFTLSLKQDPKSFLALNNRALAWIAKENYVAAKKDLQAALKLIPEYPEALNNRGVVHQKLKQHQRAIADFTAALTIDERYADALGNRAFTYRLTGNYRKAISDLEAAIKLNPETFEASNDLAWLLATAKDKSVRDSERSLTLAQAACGISQYKQWNTLDTLAAAYAENGRYDDAAVWLNTAVELAPDKEKPRIQRHLRLVMNKQPIRE